RAAGCPISCSSTSSICSWHFRLDCFPLRGRIGGIRDIELPRFLAVTERQPASLLTLRHVPSGAARRVPLAHWAVPCFRRSRRPRPPPNLPQSRNRAV